jgi:hypothetical protein
MDDNEQKPAVGKLALILAGTVLAALVVFISTGGNLGGTKTVKSDADLPKVVSPVPPSGSSETVGSR